jgi:hypothetical protein
MRLEQKELQYIASIFIAVFSTFSSEASSQVVSLKVIPLSSSSLLFSVYGVKIETH